MFNYCKEGFAAVRSALCVFLHSKMFPQVILDHQNEVEEPRHEKYLKFNGAKNGYLKDYVTCTNKIGVLMIVF